MEPIYIKTLRENKFKEKEEKLFKILENCELCPRKCKVNRLKGEKGYCNSTSKLIVSSYFPHFGEEKVLVGKNGSGTIFFSNCNLKCIYCQNYEISHFGFGSEISEEKLAKMMLELQKIGCHNINLVTPTHFTPQIVMAIKIGAEGGLRLPIVYNCSGYENVKTIKLLDGIVDIYMPDIKYSNPKSAKKYSNAPDYFEVCKLAVKEMYRQVGDLKIEKGIAKRGLLIRHLVLPNNLAGTERIMKFIADEISKDSFVNIMDQYRPEFKALEHKELKRKITRKEFEEAIKIAKKYGLHNFL